MSSRFTIPADASATTLRDILHRLDSLEKLAVRTDSNVTQLIGMLTKQQRSTDSR
jgi:hypothetical protein